MMTGELLAGCAAFWAGVFTDRLLWPHLRARAVSAPIDPEHVERIQRQIRSGAIRLYDQKIQDVAIVSANGDVHHLQPKDSL